MIRIKNKGLRQGSSLTKASVGTQASQLIKRKWVDAMKPNDLESKNFLESILSMIDVPPMHRWKSDCSPRFALHNNGV
jgi:hypothetical protein